MDYDGYDHFYDDCSEALIERQTENKPETDKSRKNKELVEIVFDDFHVFKDYRDWTDEATERVASLHSK